MRGFRKRVSVGFRGDQSFLDELLCEASVRGRADAAKYLLSHGADPNASQDGHAGYPTAFIAAIARGTAEVARLLIRHGARLHCEYVWMSPLGYAVFRGDVPMMRAVLELGADPNEPVCAEWDVTPVMIAIAENHTSCVELLLRRGANANVVCHDLATGFSYKSVRSDWHKDRGEGPPCTPLVAEVERFPSTEDVIIDFQDARFYVPSAMATLLSVVSRLSLSGRQVSYSNCESCEAFGYFQRMDFFALSGIQLPESFKRHDPDGRFVPLCEVTAGTRGNVGIICSRLAGCVFPELAESADPDLTGPFDLVEYAASELINNVLQHSRGTGYVAAQVYPKSGLVRLSVADSGIGIRQSFSENRPPFWDEAMTDLDSVRTALQPKVSSKTHLGGGWGQGVVNAGVGLSMLKAIAKHTDGLFTLISGSGLYQHNHMEHRRLPSEFQLPTPYQGTICALQLSKQKLGNLQQILQSAKIDLGLLSPGRNFDRLFE